MMDCFAISVTNLLPGMGMQRKMWKDVSEKAERYNILLHVLYYVIYTLYMIYQI